MSSKEIKISEVRSCGNLKEEDTSAHQVIRLKPISQLTKKPEQELVNNKQKPAVGKTVVGNTTIRVLKKVDGSVVSLNNRGIVLRKISKGNLANPVSPQKIIKQPPSPQQRILANEELQLPKEPPLKTFKTYSSHPVKTEPTTPTSPQQKPRIIKVIKIEGLTDEQVAHLPIQVINCIKKLQIENNFLKKKLLDFRKETVSLAHHLLKVSNEMDHTNIVPAVVLARPRETPIKRKLEQLLPSELNEPEAKKVKKTIRMPKFPINTAAGLSQFEKDLITPEFNKFVFQRLQAHLKSRNDINQENFFEAVLSSMINVDVLGEISYDQKTNSVAPYQLCFKIIAKFIDLYCKLLNSFSLPQLDKETDMQEVEEFLQRKLLMRGKILQYQKKNETGKNLKITKVVVNKPKDTADNFKWIDDSDTESK